MKKYFIRDITPDDYRQAAAVYNSNRGFLLTHLGVESVDEAFISSEAAAMQKAGFRSCVIVSREKQEIIGVLDYRSGRGEAYLSLLMLAADFQRKGAGREIYACFESEMLQQENTLVRIDVVNGGCDNAAPFWRKMGFWECETVNLEWGNKKSKALVMRKKLCGK